MNESSYILTIDHGLTSQKNKMNDCVNQILLLDFGYESKSIWHLATKESKIKARVTMLCILLYSEFGAIYLSQNHQVKQASSVCSVLRPDKRRERQLDKYLINVPT